MIYWQNPFLVGPTFSKIVVYACYSKIFKAASRLILTRDLHTLIQRALSIPALAKS
jgi:hypothetical protein